MNLFENLPIKCWCHTCNPIDYTKPETVFMRLCPDCGNKRCPKATDHNLQCTNSNSPNQEGSIYQMNFYDNMTQEERIKYLEKEVQRQSELINKLYKTIGELQYKENKDY